ncbi:cystathionine gamma-lyase [Galendromus occidentalis]|uniref:cystathionine gamma-lyase n=1 Tax=Galendromus occidentalis TaxID=34638 RepID=A0AAJ6VWN9_9ACAR|nr:cystathionine gamma-lyase [Galendromus occidentalis]
MPATDQELSFETKVVHVGQDPQQWNSRAVVPPISMATTFQQRGPADHAGFEYSRSGNPTRSCLEELLASLENAKFAMCYASGLAATDNVVHLLETGDHIVAFDDLYGGVGRLFRACAMPKGIEVDFVDARDPQVVAAALKPNTKLVWVETPSNPMMKIVDIAAVSAAVKKGAPQAILAVDNTFMSPCFQNPLQQGADIVIHSITKYINGHSDIVMGCIMTNNLKLHEKLRFLQNAVGAVPSPFDCYMVNRGIKTLALRMQRHHENALKVAKFLETHPLVEKVIHPGLESHPQHLLAKRQCSGFSGMLCFYLKGGLAESRKLLSALKLFTLAESLGAVESLAELPSVMTHASVPAELRARLGISDALIRLSVGIEAVQDLIDDLDQALAASQK